MIIPDKLKAYKIYKLLSIETNKENFKADTEKLAEAFKDFFEHKVEIKCNSNSLTATLKIKDLEFNIKATRQPIFSGKRYIVVKNRYIYNGQDFDSFYRAIAIKYLELND